MQKRGGKKFLRADASFFLHFIIVIYYPGDVEIKRRMEKRTRSAKPIKIAKDVRTLHINDRELNR